MKSTLTSAGFCPGKAATPMLNGSRHRQSAPARSLSFAAPQRISAPSASFSVVAPETVMPSEARQDGGDRHQPTRFHRAIMSSDTGDRDPSVRHVPQRRQRHGSRLIRDRP